ncbi:DUF6415 family natural product biosynthesis protein [Streptomyces sp. NPDC055210]
MRGTARQALASDMPDSEATLLIAQLRGEIELMIPEVEAIITRQISETIPGFCARACLGEARMKLGLTATGLSGEAAYARRLGRVLVALCDHYENLGGRHS